MLSVGRAAQGVELRIESPDEDGIGEVAVRADHLFQIDDDGWRRTGDLGRISDEGYLSLHGRVNDRIIRGGENIYPTELEEDEHQFWSLFDQVRAARDFVRVCRTYAPHLVWTSLEKVLLSSTCSRTASSVI